MDTKEIIDRIKYLTGLKQKDIASEIFGISDKNLSNKIRRGSVDMDILVRWAGNASVDLNWLLTGNGSPYIKEEQAQPEQEAHAPPSTGNVIELRHMELVRGFSDKQRAYEINRELMELEKLDRDAFRRIESYIKGTVDQVRFAAERTPYYGQDRRINDRRQGEGNNDLPEGGDRRTGKDRRKSASK